MLRRRKKLFLSVNSTTVSDEKRKQKRGVILKVDGQRNPPTSCSSFWGNANILTLCLICHSDFDIFSCYFTHKSFDTLSQKKWTVLKPNSVCLPFIAATYGGSFEMEIKKRHISHSRIFLIHFILEKTTSRVLSLNITFSLVGTLMRRTNRGNNLNSLTSVSTDYKSWGALWQQF